MMALKLDAVVTDEEDTEILISIDHFVCRSVLFEVKSIESLLNGYSCRNKISIPSISDER